MAGIVDSPWGRRCADRVHRAVPVVPHRHRAVAEHREDAHVLKDYFGFLDQHRLDWREARLEDLGEFVAWLRRPPGMRDSSVAVLPSVEAHCTESTVNRKLSALSAFYEHAARHGVDLGELLITWQPARRRRGSWKPFLHHVSAGGPVVRRTISLHSRVRPTGRCPRLHSEPRAASRLGNGAARQSARGRRLGHAHNREASSRSPSSRTR
ncbi:site-specific integrase [Streptomyces kebangsaanensis]|uniref:site-specific integrase n=1 Tax=Streptomyces kebangsaanensis TaxID=864058 RepID=UPI00389A46C3